LGGTTAAPEERQHVRGWNGTNGGATSLEERQQHRRHGHFRGPRPAALEARATPGARPAALEARPAALEARPVALGGRPAWGAHSSTEARAFPGHDRAALEARATLGARPRRWRNTGSTGAPAWGARRWRWRREQLWGHDRRRWRHGHFPGARPAALEEPRADRRPPAWGARPAAPEARATPGARPALAARPLVTGGFCSDG